MNTNETMPHKMNCGCEECEERRALAKKFRKQMTALTQALDEQYLGEWMDEQDAQQTFKSPLTDVPAYRRNDP